MEIYYIFNNAERSKVQHILVVIQTLYYPYIISFPGECIVFGPPPLSVNTPEALSMWVSMVCALKQGTTRIARVS